MTAGRSERGPVKIRRRGRHATPTQVEKVARQAGKAAPAVAIAGALVAAPQAAQAAQAAQALAGSAGPVAVTAQSHTTAATATATARTMSATLDAVATRSVTLTAAKQARHVARAQSRTYRVQAGDTLSKLANRFFHNSDWQYLYHENDKRISDPDLIYPGQSLFIPASAPAHYPLTGYVPRHAKPAVTAAPAVHTVSAASSGDNDSDDYSRAKASSASRTTRTSTTHSSSTKHTSSTHSSTTHTSAVAVQSAGHYSCSGLEQLWKQAGGSPGAAVMAAEIAMAESGGNPNAISPTNDFGLWQINGSHGSLATLNPQANARSAVIVSSNGTNWNPWTTYRTGAYYGRC